MDVAPSRRPPRPSTPETTTDPFAVLYLAVQLALRDALARVEADALVRTARAEAIEELPPGASVKLR